MKTDFEMVNMVATMLRNHHIHVYLEDKAVLYGGNEDNPNNEPLIQVVSNIDSEPELQNEPKARDEGDSELEVQKEPEARDEGYSSIGLDMQGDDSDNSDSDFHESEYETVENDDHVYEGIVDFEIENDLGSVEGCNGGQADGVSALDVLYGVRVNGEDVNQDGSEYASSGSLHSVHESDSNEVS